MPAFSQEKIDSVCLSPVVSIGNLSLKEVFDQYEFSSYLSMFESIREINKIKKKVNMDDLDNLFDDLKNIAALIRYFEQGRAFSGILSTSQKKYLNELAEKGIQGIENDAEIILELKNILEKGLVNTRQLRRVLVQLVENTDYKIFLNRLERKLILANHVVSRLHQNIQDRDANNILENITYKKISQTLTETLLAKDVDIDYIGTILLAISYDSDPGLKAIHVLGAADEIVAYINIFEDRQIDSEYINLILKGLINSDNTRNMALIVSDLDGAINISKLIRRFEQKEIPSEYIKEILQTILSLDDVKQRSSELESILSSPQLQFIGNNQRTTISVLERISHIDNISLFVNALKKTVLSLPKSRPDLAAREERASGQKQKGAFKRSIVSVWDKKSKQPIGSAFVIQEQKNGYVLLTNNHVIDHVNEVLLKTHGFDSEIIGPADVILSRIGDRRKDGDLAQIFISKENIRGTQLVPIEIFDQDPKQKVVAVLVGGVNETVSAGHYLKAGDSAILVGAASEPGDSGSPVLVETTGGYAAIGVHVAAGPMLVRLTERLKQELLGTTAETVSVDPQQGPSFFIMGDSITSSSFTETIGNEFINRAI
jgi:hypothetical protein